MGNTNHRPTQGTPPKPQVRTAGVWPSGPA
nr:MAG TPA: hypothetical protein [Caudoviricetes sp.]